MEVLEEKIKKFLKINISYGYGNGSGYGNGYGNGSGDGDGDGSGYGYDNGSGDGDGDGYGNGSGDGDGYGYGYCYDCNKIKSINNNTVYNIGGVQTIIYSVRDSIARGAIVHSDLNLEKCYIAKGQNKFAHGKTIKEAVSDLQEKILKDMDTEEVIEEFRKKFNNTDKYKGEEFYKWHNILTHSCKMRRDMFVKNHGINLKNEYTVKEFIEICENDYGREIIKQLKEFYK